MNSNTWQRNMNNNTWNDPHNTGIIPNRMTQKEVYPPRGILNEESKYDDSSYLEEIKRRRENNEPGDGRRVRFGGFTACA